MVASLVTERMKQIHQICRRYQVERLHLFGSAADIQMRPDSLNRTNPEITSKFAKYREIIGFRTLLASPYRKINDRRTWDIVENHLPVLEAEAERALSELD